MVVFGAAMSIFDVAINTEGSVLESLTGRPVMSNLHGMFSVGAMAGAALVAYLLTIDDRAADAAHGDLRRHRDGGRDRRRCACCARTPSPASDGPTAHFAWPRGLLLVIGLLIFAGMTAEGVMYDWSVLYLHQNVGMSQAWAAAGYAVFTAAMALARFGGDALRARYSERRAGARGRHGGGGRDGRRARDGHAVDRASSASRWWARDWRPSHRFSSTRRRACRA